MRTCHGIKLVVSHDLLRLQSLVAYGTNVAYVYGLLQAMQAVAMAANPWQPVTGVSQHRGPTPHLA